MLMMSYLYNPNKDGGFVQTGRFGLVCKIISLLPSCCSIIFHLGMFCFIEVNVCCLQGKDERVSTVAGKGMYAASVDT